MTATLRLALSATMIPLGVTAGVAGSAFLLGLTALLGCLLWLLHP